MVLSMVFTLNWQQTCNNGEDDETEDVCGIAPSPFHLPTLAEEKKKLDTQIINVAMQYRRYE